MEELINFSDEKLVMLYANGLNKAFDILVERYKNKVYSYIFHIVKCEDLADDIFQETFVKAIVTINQRRYTENGKFLPWIMRIAHNLIIDFYRQEKSENTQSCDSEQVNILNRKDLADSTIEDTMITEQIYLDIKKLVNALPQNQRDVLTMRYYKNMSFKEIAESTNVSINTALGRMRYAIMNMRKLAEENNIILTL